ncbi:FtsX-like permease family protein [Streptomyces sp. CBMA29]|uniref:FtsX-like permease family protein n=1 Tax=Streptomyces sp. CBMA29 TaxID=1896314 RepID=UPI001661E692|nr:ABC transporter permease [Streptomyces sp. CBMA29]
MIALPIIGVSAADITIRSSQLSPEQKLSRDIGTADARLTDVGTNGQPIYQDPPANMWTTVEEATAAPDATSSSVDTAEREEAPKPVDPRVGLPRGARWISDAQSYVRFKTKYGLLAAPIRELKTADPLARGITHLDRGRHPAADDEVIATTAFLKSANLKVGSKLAVRDLDRTYRIVGAYDLPDSLGAEEVIARPGAFLAPYAAALKALNADDERTNTTYLVEMPDGDYTWQMVRQANAKGVFVKSRAVVLHKPDASEVPLYTASHGSFTPYNTGDSVKAAAVTVAATIVGLSMLEICLLAGPAFAVGARRSRRQLGLVGANGGDRRHVRAIVLSGGLVIGVTAAVVGTLLGLLLTVLLRSPLENFVGSRFGGLTLRPLELLGIAGLAVLTGLLAAVVPAVTASRQSVLASLTGRRGVRHANRLLPVIGLGAICLGVGIAVFGSLRTDSTLAVGGGSGIAELGIVALTPTLVGMFGRTGKWLPLSPRLALRDAVRNRGRTAPAVAAVLAAVAGTVAVATYSASADRQDRDAYEAQVPRGVVAVAAYSDHGRDLTAVRAAIEKRYPVSGRADVFAMVIGGKNCQAGGGGGPGCGGVQPVMPPANVCPTDRPDGATALTLTQRRALAHDWRCDFVGGMSAMPTSSAVLIGGPAVLHALGIRDGDAEQALARGETVLFDKGYLDHGALKLKITLDLNKPVPDGQEPVGPVKSVPVHLAAEDRHHTYGMLAVMPQQAADGAGIATMPLGSFYTNARMPNGPERQALDSDLAKIGTDTEVYLERGYTKDNSLVLLALTLFAGLVTIGAAGIATGLAQADAEPDLKTLAAIGAPPRVRRTLSGLQCGVIATMGVVLGSAAGVLPAVGLRHTERREQWKFYHQALDGGWGGASKLPHVPIVVPWSTLALLIVAVPLGAALLAALVTRSRTQLARRAEP